MLFIMVHMTVAENNILVHQYANSGVPEKNW